jgi:hypothetical protein
MDVAVLVILTLWTQGLAGPSRAQTDRGVQIEDRVDVLRVDRRLLAVSADSGHVLEEKLRLDERLLRLESEGVVGVAVTDQRLLGVTTRSSSWQEVRLRAAETSPESIHLGDRLALVLLDRRLLSLTRGSGIWTELRLSKGELPARIAVDSGVGFCVTGRRAIAVSSDGTGFVQVHLTPREEVESVSLKDQSVTLRTLYRVLVFRSGFPRWLELRRTDFRGLTPE